MHAPEQPAFLTREEVAAMLRVSPNLVSRAYHKRELKGVRVGRVLRFRRCDVEALAATKPQGRGR